MINSYLCAIRVITLKHNNEELRNTNGCYLVTQFSSSSTNRLILSELSFLAKVTIIIERTNISDKILSQYLYYFNPFLRSNSSISFKLMDSRSALS